MAPKIFQTKVDALIAAGIQPTLVARSGRSILKGDGSSIALADAKGKLTAAGKYYYAKTGKERPRIGFDENTPLERDGGKEYVRYRDGSLKLARKWNPA